MMNEHRDSPNHPDALWSAIRMRNFELNSKANGNWLSS